MAHRPRWREFATKGAVTTFPITPTLTMGSRYGDHSDRYKPDLPAFEWRAGHTPYLFIFPIFLQSIDEEIFHFLARPRCLAEKLEAGFDRGIIIEAANFHALTEAFPSIEFLQADTIFSRVIPWSGLLICSLAIYVLLCPSP